METAVNPDIYLALKRAEQLDSFGFEVEYADMKVYGQQVLTVEYGVHDDDLLLRYVDMAGFGLAAAQDSGYEITQYGAVRLPSWPEAAKASVLAQGAYTSLMESCEQNDWLMNYNEYPAHDYPYTFEEIEDAATLAQRFRYGNWSIRTGFLYGGLAFVQQVNGGDEWLALRQDKTGEWESFDSISMEYILHNQEVAAFESYVDGLVRTHGCPMDQNFGEITMQ